MENNVTVLLIDNNEIDNFINKRVLENLSDRIRLYTFSKTSDALMYIDKNKIVPQYILLSMSYPATDNFDFIEQLEKININKENTSICIISTLLLPSDIERLKSDYNCINYVEKPLSVKKLMNIMNLGEFKVEIRAKISGIYPIKVG